jgi:hypothetical protein
MLGKDFVVRNAYYGVVYAATAASHVANSFYRGFFRNSLSLPPEKAFEPTLDFENP